MKRTENDYNNYNKSKRIKLQQNDDIWGDDPAIEDVDRCIDLATQICSQTQGPSSMNYEYFKHKSNLVASTQLNIQHYEEEKRKILEENETRKGEITFLRAQLKQADNLLLKEKMERLKILQENQETWNEKISNKNKELSQMKCESDLKTLQLVILREKLNELKKQYNCNVTVNNDEQIIQPQNCIIAACNKTTDNHQDNSFIYTYKNIFYPYKEILLHFEDNLNEINIKDFTKILNYTEEQLNNSEDFLQFIIGLEKNVREYLISFLIKLIKTNIKEPKLNDNNCNNFYLNSTNDVEYNYENIFSAKAWSDFEKRINLRRLIAIVAYLSEHSSILRNILQQQLCNDFNRNEMCIIDDIKRLNFLQVLLQITIYIKNHYLTEQLCGFLASTLKLLTVLIERSIQPANDYNIILEIFKQILFAQPNEPVLQYICYFLKYISEHGYFMTMLCTKKKSNQTVIKDGLLYFTDETCTLKILVTIIETCKLQIDTACNLMHFLQNLATCNVDWMYQQNSQRCGCLADIYGLGINILYKSLDKFSSYKNAFLNIFHVGLLFLHILTVRIPDLVAKSSRLYSQYQTIIKYMYKMRHELLLTNAHETMLDNLISQLNCDIIQNETVSSSNKSSALMINSYNCNFINF